MANESVVNEILTRTPSFVSELYYSGPDGVLALGGEFVLYMLGMGLMWKYLGPFAQDVASRTARAVPGPLSSHNREMAYDAHRNKRIAAIKEREEKGETLTAQERNPGKPNPAFINLHRSFNALLKNSVILGAFSMAIAGVSVYLVEDRLLHRDVGGFGGAMSEGADRTLQLLSQTPGIIGDAFADITGVGLCIENNPDSPARKGSIAPRACIL